MRRARRRSAEWFRGRTRLIARIFSMARMACRYGGGRYLGLDRRIGIRGRRRDGRLGAAYGAGLQEMGGASGCARFRRLSRLRADEPAGALCPIPERISGRRTYGRPCRSLSDRREAQDAYASLFPEACGGRPISIYATITHAGLLDRSRRGSPWRVCGLCGSVGGASTHCGECVCRRAGRAW